MPVVPKQVSPDTVMPFSAENNSSVIAIEDEDMWIYGESNCQWTHTHILRFEPAGFGPGGWKWPTKTPSQPQ